MKHQNILNLDERYLYCTITGLLLQGVSKIDFPEDSSLEKLLQYYGNDFITPATFYLLGRFIEIRPRNLILTLAIGTGVFETVQGLAHVKGYDPYDFLAYGTGLGLAYLIDQKLKSKNSASKNP